MINKQILLTWDAFNNGFVVTANTVFLLEKESIQIDEIIYLQHQKLSECNLAEIDVFYKKTKLSDAIKNCKEDKYRLRLHDCYDISTKIKKIPKFRNKNININNVTDYQSIYDNIINFLKLEFKDKSNFNLHINVSPGTPHMHVVWLMLNSAGFLPAGTSLWSSQWVKEKNKTVLNKVNFKPRTLLSEVLKSKYLKKYQPEINPNETVSSKRRAAEERIRLFAHIPNSPILLIGERGTGKSTYTRTLINRYQEEYIEYAELACGTFSEELMRSELFGHEAGAFTGAIKKKEGILAKFRKNGILFLDEIHDLSKPLQRQLMQVLQTGEYYPIGSDKSQKSAFKLVTASNLTYQELSNRLDADFLDRIARFVVEIPPLRECRNDIQNYWLKVWREVANFEDAPPVIWNKKLKEFLFQDNLYGNFRDLQKIASYIIAFYFETKDKKISVDKALEEFSKWKADKPMQQQNSYFIKNKTHQEIIANFERDLTLWAIKEYGGKKEAALKLGRTEDMLNKYLKRYRLNKKK